MTDESPQAGDTPAPDANASPEVTETTGSEAAPSPAVTDPDDTKQALKGVSKRIDELTRNWREEQRRNEQLMGLLAQRQEPAKPAEPVAAKKTLADFNYDEGQYQDYLFQQAEQRAVAAAEKRLKEQSETEAANRRRSTFAQREQGYSKDKPDYFEKTRDPRVPFSQTMAEVVAESEDGPALAYYLASNLAQADAIAQLPPLAAARELGRIEAKLSSEREKAKTTPPVSKAPPPPAKIEGAGDPQVEKDPTQMTDSEFAKWRQRQIAQRR